MNLFSAPADISSKDLPLRDDVRLLGRILGETLREQEGEESFQLIETVRRAAVQFRKTQDDRDRVQLEKTLDALNPSETLAVVRAFSYFSQLSNIADDLHQNRRHRSHLKAGDVPKDGSLMLALKRIEDKKIAAKNLGRKVADGEIKSACQQTCPANAIVFGNVNDPESEVAKLVQSGRAYHVLNDVGTHPSVRYLTKVRNVDAVAAVETHHVAEPSHG